MLRNIKKRISQIVALSLMIAMAIGFMPQMAVPVYAEGEPAMVCGSMSALENGDNFLADTPIVWYAGNNWHVINYNEDGNEHTFKVYWDNRTERWVHGMTLFSADCIKTEQKFNNLDGNWNNDYKDSDLQAAVDELYESLFSEQEKQVVLLRELEVDEYDEGKTNRDLGQYYSKGISGTATAGYLWPLSTSEAMYLSLGLKVDEGEGHTLNGNWWLRSPGDGDYYAAFVTGKGVIQYDGDSGDFNQKYGVRPAFNMDLDYVLFTSAAVGGKLSGAEGADALQKVGWNDDGGTGSYEWKLTLDDNIIFRDGETGEPFAGLSGHKDFEVTDCTATDNGVSVKYTGAKTGTNEYISAIITNGPIPRDSDEYGPLITYYGRIKNCASDDDASGTVEINTANKLRENDKLYIFNEQYNGDKKTDYASALYEVTPYPPVGSVRPVSIKDAEVVLSKTAFTYNAKVQKPTIKTIKGLTLKEGTDYTAEWSNASSKDSGTYKVTITGKGDYKDTTTATYKINKAANPLKISSKNATIKYSKLKKNAQTLAVTKVMKLTNNVKDKKAYKLSSAKKGKKSFKKYFKINKTTGKVTMKKGLKKGPYNVKVKVKAAGNSNYKASGWKPVTFKIKVR